MYFILFSKAPLAITLPYPKIKMEELVQLPFISELEVASGFLKIPNPSNERIAFKIRIPKDSREHVKVKPAMGLVDPGSDALVEVSMKNVKTGMIQVNTADVPSVYKNNEVSLTSMGDLWQFVLPRDIRQRSVNLRCVEPPGGSLSDKESKDISSSEEELRIYAPAPIPARQPGADAKFADYLDRVTSGSEPVKQENVLQRAIQRIGVLEQENQDLAEKNAELGEHVDSLQTLINAYRSQRKQNRKNVTSHAESLPEASSPGKSDSIYMLKLIFVALLALIVVLMGHLLKNDM